MSVARHNPHDAQGGAKALMWEEREALKKEFSLTAQFDRYTRYRELYAASHAQQDQIRVNQSHREEQRLLKQKRLDNMRIAGPRDGMRGTLSDDNIGGDPYWYRKQLAKDGKVPLGPKTAFNGDDFITEMQQTSTILNSLSQSDRAQYIPVHYPNSIAVAGLAPHEAALLSPELALEQQYVDSHMMYASLLSTQKDIDLADSLKVELINGLRREYHFLKHNPSAKPKDLSNLLTHYHQLGRPLNLMEEEQLFNENQNDVAINAQIQTLDLNNRSLIEATKTKLSKLRGNVGIQQQIKTALEFSQNALQRTIGLQNNPEFHDLSPAERAEYLNFIKEDLALEQDRLDRTIQLNVGEIQELRQYDRIQLLPQDRIPYLPLPRFASRSLDTLNTVPYIINQSHSANGGQLTMAHPFLFDTRNIFNNCMPIAINYTQCLRANQWAVDVEAVPQCNQLSTQLFRCQQQETVAIQANSSQSWGKVLTKWLWGEESAEAQSGPKSFQNLINLDELAQHGTVQQYQHHPTTPNRTAPSHPTHHAHIQPTTQQQGEFKQASALRHGPAQVHQTQAGQLLVAQQDAYHEGAAGWLTSWSLPFWNSQTNARIQSIPNQSPTSHTQPVPADLIHYQLSATNIDADTEHLMKTGPLDLAQQRYLYEGQHNGDYEDLSPGYRRYYPRDQTKSKSNLFNSDHLYRHWLDSKDVEQMVDADWEHLEQYGTAAGDQFALAREDPVEEFEDFNHARHFLPARPPDNFATEYFPTDGNAIVSGTNLKPPPRQAWW